MLSDSQLQQQLEHVLTGTDFDFLGQSYRGKVRDSYLLGDQRILITTDRLSCFDAVVTTVPFKGQVLNQLALHWFKKTEKIIPNHILAAPDPNVIVVRNCEIFPVEVVVRGYLTGSAWRDYQAGKPISGVKLPAGLRCDQQLPEVILTPSTKAEQGQHDQPISETEIVEQGLVSGDLWQQVRAVAFELFDLGQREAEQRGLILVDTKYEFGLLEGQLLLADEIHTLDSSRYWIRDSYQARFEVGEPPVMLDKEPTRQWLLQQGYQGQGAIPEFTSEHRIAIARRYVGSYEQVTGCKFEGEVGPVLERIERNLHNYCGK